MLKPKKHTPNKPRPNMWDAEEPSAKAKSMGNEKRLSKALGFRLTPGSGNTPWVSVKGDGVTSEFMVECKETKGSKIIVGIDILTKLCNEAARAGKDPVLVLSAYGIPDPIPKEWVCFPLGVFEE